MRSKAKLLIFIMIILFSIFLYVPSVSAASWCGTSKSDPCNDEGESGKSKTAGLSAKAADPVYTGSGGYEWVMPLFYLGGPMNFNLNLTYNSKLPANYFSSFFFPNPNHTKFHLSLVGIGKLYNGPHDSGRNDYNDVQLPGGNMVSFIWDNDKQKWVQNTNPWEDYPNNVSPVAYQAKDTPHTFWILDPIRELIYVYDMDSDPVTDDYLRYIMDRNGNKLSYTYDDVSGNGDIKLTSIEDGYGRKIEFSYTNFNSHYYIDKITDKTDPNNPRSYTFSYETGNEKAFDNCNKDTLRKITDPLNHVYRFEYEVVMDVLDSSTVYPENLRRVYLPKGNYHVLTEYHQYIYKASNGQWLKGIKVEYQIDAYGNRTDFDYNDDPYYTTVTYPDGSKRRFEQDSDNAPTKKITDEAEREINFATNEQNRVTGVTDRLGSETEVTYDEASGKIASITNAAGKKITFTYSAQQQTFTRPDNGEQATFTFYNLVKITYPDNTCEEFSYDSQGNLTSYTDRGGHSWSFEYDSHGFITKIKAKDGDTEKTIVSYTYNDDGTMSKKIDGELNATTTYKYDQYKRLIEIDFPDGKTIRYSYDANDNLTSFTNPDGKVFTYFYDENGNMEKVTTPDGSTYYSFSYDDMDRLKSITDMAGNTLTFEYDSMGRLKSITDAENNKIQYKFNKGSRWIDAIVDSSGNSWTFSYDYEGSLKSIKTPNGLSFSITTDKLGYPSKFSDPNGNAKKFEYNDAGFLSKITDEMGRTTNFSYEGAKLKKTSISGIDTSVSYSYDNFGNLSSIVDLNGKSWRFSYSFTNRLKSLKDPLGRTISIDYDKRGRVKTITYPDGVSENFTYNGGWNVVSRSYSTGLTLQYTYDDLGRVIEADHVEIQYNNQNLPEKTVYDTIEFSATYYKDKRLKSIGYNNGSFVVTYTYTNGLLTKVSDSSGNWVTFEYDNDGKLNKVKRSNNITTSYKYDSKTGSLIEIDDGEWYQKFTLNKAKEVTGVNYKLPLDPSKYIENIDNSFSYDDASQVSQDGYSYDYMGKLTKCNGKTLVWDAAGRLTKIGDVTFSYDGLDKIISRKEGDTETKFYHNYAILGAPIVAEKDASSSQFSRYYVWTPSGQLLYMVDVAHENKVYFYHYDHLGSTLFLTDSSGQVTDSYAYTPYGLLIRHDGDSTQPFTFIGKFGTRTDGEFYEMGARYYHPSTARFITRDPAWPDLMNPLALNPYVYAGMNPVNNSDPTGMGWFSDWAGDLWAGITHPMSTISGLWARSHEEAKIHAQLSTIGKACWKSEAWKKQVKEMIRDIRCRLRKLELSIDPAEWGERKRLMDLLNMLKDGRWTPKAMAGLNNLSFQGDLALQAFCNIVTAPISGSEGAAAEAGKSIVTPALKKLGKTVAKELSKEFIDFLRSKINCDARPPKRRIVQSKKRVIERPPVKKVLTEHKIRVIKEAVGRKEASKKLIDLVAPSACY